MVKLRKNEVLCHELDEQNNQVLEMAVNEETCKTRFLRVLPDNEAEEILNAFICHDTDEEFIGKCKKILNTII